MDGVLDCWDILQQQNEPVLSIKVADDPLLCLRTNDNGRFVSCGSKKGAAYLIEMSENMTFSAKNDKPLLTAVRRFPELEDFDSYVTFSRCLNVKIEGRRYWKQSSEKAS